MTTPSPPANEQGTSVDSAPASVSVGQLSSEKWAVVSALFDQLLDSPDAAIDDSIKSSNLDPDAQALLRQMITANGSQSILDESIDGLAERVLDLHSLDSNSIPDDLIGRTFGSWLVTRELARGGMGAVFEAKRVDGQFEKTVALKVIKPGAYSDHTAQRFVDEMRTLARLEHPCIARLVDGGLNADEIPYFAMELVDGEPITIHADHRKLSIRERVDLLIQVCAAVEHAHRNLIVHGDLKPSNILVNESGQVRLLDFGIAQSLQPQDGSLVLPRFTPEYAAPEQIGNQRLTTSCDVFGMAAVLFELCCGSAPRAGQSANNADQHRALLSKPIPATAQRFMAARDQQAIAERRATTPRALRRLLDGDLGLILRKGLEIDPAARLSNVTELRAELDRWQRGMALDSHPPRIGYRLRRWVGRHRVSVSIAAIALCGLLLAGLGLLRQTQIATSESAKAQWSKEFLLNIFRQADPLLNEQQPITVNALTDGAADKLLANSASIAPELQIEAASVLAEVQYNLGRYDSAVALSEQRLTLARQGSDRHALIAAMVAHGESLEAVDQIEPAIELLREVLKLAPLDNDADPLSVSATQQLAMLLARISEYEEARAMSDELLRHETLIAGSPDGADMLAKIYITRSAIERDQGQADPAMQSIEHALAYARLVGEKSRTYVDALSALAALHYSIGDARATADVDQQVVALFDELYGSDHPLTLQARSELAVSLSQMGEMTRALELDHEVLAGYRGSIGENNQNVAATLANMGASERALGHFQERLDHYERSLAIWRGLDSTPPITLISVLLGHGRILIELQRYADAEISFLEALALIDQSLGSDHIMHSRAQAYFAPVLIETGRVDEAAAMLDPAYDRLVEKYGGNSLRTSVTTVTLAHLREAQGNSAEAHNLAQAAIAVLDVEGVRQRHAIELAKARQILERTRP